MGGLDRDALDRHIAGGHYSRSLILVTCGKCGAETPVTEESEYGMNSWTPMECGNKKCGADFDGDEKWVDDEGPEPNHPENE